MKILITTGIFMPEIGGPATYAYKISQQFLALGHQVAILTYSRKMNEDFDKQLPYQVIRIPRRNKLSNYFKYYQTLKKILRQADYDLIYSFDHLSAGLPAVLANIKFHKKLLIRVGGDFIWERYISRTGNLVTLSQFYRRQLHLKHEKLRFKLIQWVFKRADKIIFTTEFQRDIFLPVYQINPSQTAIIHNPVDSLIRPERNHQANKDILFAGRFIQKNNINFLIDAFLAMRDKTFNLGLIGEGPLKPLIEQRLKTLKTQRIKIIDKLIGAELIKRLSQSYLVVFPSLTDISPNTLLECLQNNIPFISTNQIGYNWFDHKVKTFHPQKLEQLVSVLDELADKQNYQNYQRQLAQLDYSFTYQDAARATLDIINQI